MYHKRVHLFFYFSIMNANPVFAIIGSGSWATALAKLLHDRNHTINWWVRSSKTKEHIEARGDNPHYLRSIKFNKNQLAISTDLQQVINQSDVLVVAVPSAYIEDVFEKMDPGSLHTKKIISAIKGILPRKNILFNTYLEQKFSFPQHNYFAVLGPCHAEEVADEKLSYLTYSGLDIEAATALATHFKTSYINTIINKDVMAVQYAAVLKNIYALGAGIAHGLEYGDNFLSVYIANAAAEMARFLSAYRQFYNHDDNWNKLGEHADYASVYLGDLLVTCYSLYSRNRMFGNMIGKGYSVVAAQLEMNMVAEGINASRCIHIINGEVKCHIPIAETIYHILWQQLLPGQGFETIAQQLV